MQEPHSVKVPHRAFWTPSAISLKNFSLTA